MTSRFSTISVGYRALNVTYVTYVTSNSGTELTHQAPAFGAEDYNVAMFASTADQMVT